MLFLRMNIEDDSIVKVPACLGIIPKDAYIFPASIGKINVVRALHEVRSAIDILG